MTYAPSSALLPHARQASNGFVQGLLRRARAWAMMALGFLVILAGIAIAPLPGPGGIPVIAVGLVIVLRNSYWAKKQFVRFQHAHPRLVFPIRRLLRREPEFVPVIWQQMLRVERLLVPKTLRGLARARHRFFRR